MKYKLNLTWTTSIDKVCEAESKEAAEQMGYEEIEAISLGTSINPDVSVRLYGSVIYYADKNKDKAPGEPSDWYKENYMNQPSKQDMTFIL